MSVAKMSRRATLVAGSAWVLSACSQKSRQQKQASASTLEPRESSSTTYESQPSASSASVVTSAQNLDHTTPSSLAVLVNKHNPLSPLDWAPDDLVSFGGAELRQEAATAAEKLFAAAQEAGFSLHVVSGYRSYATQVSTYNGWVAQQGQELADVASARPGFSEHQTGLAFDVGTGAGCDLQPCFAESSEAQWLAEHCTEYGFVLRFPWQEQDTTGYWYESWHFRYIGLEQAQEYQKLGAPTLEDFWGFEPATDYL